MTSQRRRRVRSPLEAFGDGVAVVTGAGSGLGEAMARRLAVVGAKVVLVDIALDRVERVAGEIAAEGGQALAVHADVASPEALETVADRARVAFGETRLLINNAAIETVGLSWELSASAWDRALDVNLRSVVHGVRAFAPAMIAGGGRAYIVNVASVGGLGIMPVQAPYILTKHAVVAFTECLALEMDLVKANVQVSLVCPDAVATRIFSDADTACGEGAGGRLAAGHRRVMAGLVGAGMAPAEAARIILDEVAAGEFWVSPHPDRMAAAAKSRAKALATLKRPAMSALMTSLLET